MTTAENLNGHLNGAGPIRRRRRASCPRVPRALRERFECRHTDVQSTLLNATDMAGAILAMWQGVLLIKDLDEREAAIDGAITLLQEVSQHIEISEHEMKKTKAANDKIRAFRPR